MACALPSKPPRRLHSPEEAPQEESLLLQTRIVRVQVRTRPIRDGLDAVLRGLLTYYSQRLECKINLTVLIGNFQKDLMAAYYVDCCLDVRIQGPFGVSLKPNKG